jgi:TonB family protein
VALSRIEPGAFVASVAAHCIVFALGALLWSTRGGPHEEGAIEVLVEPAPELAKGGLAAEPGAANRESQPVQDLATPPPDPGGGVVARPDLERRGRGGHPGERATNLASSVDPLTLERDPLNHLTRSEVQRLKTAPQRRSLDDRRATPHPMELDFVVSGRGALALRRPIALAVPNAGAPYGAAPAVLGSTPGSVDSAGWEGQRGAPTAGRLKVEAAGIRAAQGPLHQVAVAAEKARPLVPASRAAVPTAAFESPSDTIDSHQRVADRVVRLMQASTMGGDAQGPGGERDSGAPGAGQGLASGARAVPGGAGAGLADPDDEAQTFLRRVRAAIDRALGRTFPLWAIAEGRGGLVVFDLGLSADGKVASVAVVRPSGVEEYDSNVLTAVRRIASFGPVPPAFRSGLRITYDSRNPVVGRSGPGPGHISN